MAKNYIGFTMDLRKLVSVLSQDPTCRAEITAGLQGVAEPITSQLGASNLAEAGEPDQWLTLFPATVEGKKSGDAGLFYRNRGQEGAAGDRIQMRLKVQAKSTTKPQPAQEQYQVPVMPSQAMPQGAGQATAAAALAQLQANPMFSQILAAISAQQGGAQLNSASQAQPRLEQPTEAPAAPHIPADIASIINKAG